MRAPIRLLVCTLAISALPFYAAAQGPGGPGAPGAPMQGARPQMPPPKNIQALPKDITSDQLIKQMMQYTGALGVGCGFCHGNDPATGRRDFASDVNPMKDRARTMIRMTAAINQEYLAKLPGGMHADDQVGCGTCHQGHEHPPAFTPQQGGRPQGPPSGAPPPAGE
jgi:hypothetical protein